VRAALEALAVAAPGWLAGVIDASWQQAYGQRIDAMRLPASTAARARLAIQYGQDGYRLLEAVHAPGALPWLRDLPAVAALRVIWVQQYYRDHTGTVSVRDDDTHGLPPAALKRVSPYEPDARYAVKRGTTWQGYKTHLTETCHRPAPTSPPPPPNLITDVASTAASMPDVAATAGVWDRLQAAGLPPGEHLADSGYTSADLLISGHARGITLTGPLPPRTRPGRYPADLFTIDFTRQQATCPQGHTSTTWCPHTSSRGLDAIAVRFPAATCHPCPARSQCTTATRTGRTLHLRPQPIHETITAARTTQATPAWKARYGLRAGIEATIAQATHVTGIRRARYRGLAKTRLEHALAATALNLIRLDNYWTHTPPGHTRTSHLQRLHLTPTTE
jgi:hypothetical protein